MCDCVGCKGGISTYAKLSCVSKRFVLSLKKHKSLSRFVAAHVLVTIFTPNTPLPSATVVNDFRSWRLLEFLVITSQVEEQERSLTKQRVVCSLKCNQ